MPFQIIRNDIARVRADAIVNCANPEPVIGAGSDWAVYQAAGEAELLAARREIGRLAPGQAAATPGFRLPAAWVIHAVGPVWAGGRQGERELLRRCYDESLALAERLECRSVAFPLLGAGSNGVPRETALEIATSAIGSWLLNHELEIDLVVFSREVLELSAGLSHNIECFIDEHYVEEQSRREHPPRLFSRRRNALRPEAPAQAREALGNAVGSFSTADLCESVPMAAPQNLEDMLARREDTFQQRLLRLIDERGLDDVTVYKRANVSRQVFSSIRKNRDYQPKKATALAFAIALRLDLGDTRDLLSRAGMALSPSSKFDLIVEYFIRSGNYDIFDLNNALFRYDQPTLGV